MQSDYMSLQNWTRETSGAFHHLRQTLRAWDQLYRHRFHLHFPFDNNLSLVLILIYKLMHAYQSLAKLLRLFNNI